MIIGIPKEIKAEENRVAMTPAGVSALVARGHRVLVARDAGAGSGLSDAQYRSAGAHVMRAVHKVWHEAEMIVKVKEPLPSEYRHLRPGLVLLTYLHLAASEKLTRTLRAKKVCAIGYETIQLDDGTLPLLAPMSEIAGRLSIQVGSWCLQAPSQGAGILLSGASGVRPAKVVILGAGIAGSNACQIAAGVGAHVSIIDRNPAKLRYMHDILGGHITTVMSNRANIEEEVVAADLVIGSVLIAGAKTPHLVTRKMVRAMRPGSAMVDVSIDQGGCFETSQPTSLDHPTFVSHHVVHYCVTNMPAIVPRTSTFAFTNATLSYVLELADKGIRRALLENLPLQRGVNVFAGHVTHASVAQAFGLQHTAINDLI
ncbi:MAG: alanine dehydrogenase [Candidatus Binatia bacterium]